MQRVTNPKSRGGFVAKRRLSAQNATNPSAAFGFVAFCMLDAATACSHLTKECSRYIVDPSANID